MYIPRKRQFWSVGLGHFTNDVFMSSGIVLLTFLSATIVPMSNTQIGLAISMQQLSGAISQPFFGLRADKTGGRGIGAGGLAWVVSMFAVTVLVALFTRNYYLLLLPFILQGLGSGALHPVGVLHAAESDDLHIASNTSYFFLMGQGGLALGPALVGFLLDNANRGSLTAYATLPGFPGTGLMSANVMPLFVMWFVALPVIAFMFSNIPAMPRIKVKSETVADGQAGTGRKISYTPFLIIGLLVLVRALSQPGSINFIPVLFQEKGWTPGEYGLITSSFWIASGISGVIMGNMADHYDRRMIVLVSMLISAPAFFFLPVIHGISAFPLAIIAGGFSGGSHSIIVVLAQELIPHSRGFASGAILGFIFGTGALGSLAIGVISDTIGLGATFQIVAVSAALSGFIALLLPKNR